MKGMYLARNYDGGLRLFKSRPIRLSSEWISDEGDGERIDRDLFPNVQWEAGEVEIKLIPPKRRQKTPAKYSSLAIDAHIFSILALIVSFIALSAAILLINR